MAHRSSDGDRDELYARYAKGIRGEPLPVAIVDLDAVDRNVATLTAPLARRKKTLRIATKSLRSVGLLRYIAARDPETIRGFMCYSPREACFLADRGLDDLLVAYPTALASEVEALAAKVANGARISLAAEEPEHLEVASRAAKNAGIRLPIIVDVDVSYRPWKGVSIGVRRSPLHEPRAVGDFAERVANDPHLELAGLLAYEAHIAGVPDDGGGPNLVDVAKRAMKHLAMKEARAQRAAIAEELSRRSLSIPLFDGGGSGSVAVSCDDDALTEVAAGSGFVDSHLFDGYRDVPLVPAIFFALQITRKPAPGFVTCQSGGFVASGPSGRERLPRPALPSGLELTSLEGAGEVQTPLAVPRDFALGIGDPVFFRHAKAGELAEHFTEYLLLRGERIEARVSTYRGDGQCFW